MHTILFPINRFKTFENTNKGKDQCAFGLLGTEDFSATKQFKAENQINISTFIHYKMAGNLLQNGGRKFK